MDKLSKAERSKNMAAIRGRNTKPELLIRQWLYAKGYRYRLNIKQIPGELKGIYELTWKDFLKHKKWHSRMTAWNLSLNKNVIEDAKIIFAGQESSD